MVLASWSYFVRNMGKEGTMSRVTSYYDNLAAPHSGRRYANTPWSGTYDVQSAVWVTAHMT